MIAGNQSIIITEGAWCQGWRWSYSWKLQPDSQAWISLGPGSQKTQDEQFISVRKCKISADECQSHAATSCKETC